MSNNSSPFRRLFPWISLLVFVTCVFVWQSQQPAPKPVAPTPPAKANTIRLVPQATNYLTGQSLLEALRRGGLVIYFRHFHTDHTKWHEDPIKPKHGTLSEADYKNTGDQQRQLTEFGRNRARDVGEMMRRLQVPVGRTLSSPYIRVMDSARLLTGRDPDETPVGLVYRGGKITADMTIQSLIPLLSAKPSNGSNTLIFAHRTQMDDITYIEEGEAFVFEPLGEGKFNLVATIKDSDWFEAQHNVLYLGLKGRQPGGDTVPAGVKK